MNRYDQGSQVGRGKVLNLVDEERNRAASPLGGLRYRKKHLRKVRFQAARVGRSGFWFHRELNIADFNLERLCERAKDSKSALRRFLCLVQATELEEQLPQRRDEHVGQTPILRRLDHDRLVSLGLCNLGDAVEQDGLSNTAQSKEDLTLCRTARLYPA